MDRFQDHLLSRQDNGKPLATASVRTYVRGVRVFLNWSGVAAGRFESIGEPQRLRNTLSREEIQRIERTATSERDRLIVRILADCGLRISELLGLRLRDLREDTHRHRCYIRVIGKGNIEREVGIPEDTYRRLRKFAIEVGWRPGAGWAPSAGEYIFQGRRGNRLTKNVG